MVEFKLIGATPELVVNVEEVDATACDELGSARLVLEVLGNGELPPEFSPGSARLLCRCLSSSVWFVSSRVLSGVVPVKLYRLRTPCQW